MLSIAPFPRLFPAVQILASGARQAGVNVRHTDEKGGFRVVSCKLVKQRGCVDIWAIIVSDCNLCRTAISIETVLRHVLEPLTARLYTVINSCSSIFCDSELGPWDIGSRCSGWDLVGIALRAVLILTVWSSAIFWSSTAVPESLLVIALQSYVFRHTQLESSNWYSFQGLGRIFHLRFVALQSLPLPQGKQGQFFLQSFWLSSQTSTVVLQQSLEH